MTPRQQQFAAEYALDHCGAAAAVRAGYAPRAARQTAHELLAKPDVRALVAAHEADAEQSLGLSRSRVITELKAAVTLARDQGNPSAMIAGWREIGKMCGYYAPERKQIELSREKSKLLATLEAMSTAELLAVLEGN